MLTGSFVGGYERIQTFDTRWNTSLTGMVFVCKQVYVECIGLFYLNTTFAFDSPSRIANFLRVPRMASLDNVIKIQLHYRVYGDPWLTEDVRWKEKHSQSWERICKTTAKTLINLQHIEIWIYTRQAGLHFGMDEPYLRPFRWFRKRLEPGKTLAKKLRTAKMHLVTAYNRSDSFYNPSLQLASLHLHKLFEEAVSRLILGATLDVAMEDFNSAWENDYTQWHNHLQFVRTG